MARSLTSKLHLNMRLFSYRMTQGRSLQDHLAVFKEIVIDLKILEVKYDEEDLALILLCMLSVSFTSFRGIILYSRETFTIEDTYDALYLKKKKEKKMKHIFGSEARNGEYLVVHGDQRRVKSSHVCYYCKKKNDTLRAITTNCRTKVISLQIIKSNQMLQMRPT